MHAFAQFSQNTWPAKNDKILDSDSIKIAGMALSLFFGFLHHLEKFIDPVAGYDHFSRVDLCHDFVLLNWYLFLTQNFRIEPLSCSSFWGLFYFQKKLQNYFLIKIKDVHCGYLEESKYLIYTVSKPAT